MLSLITYDLNKPDKDYPKLYDTIKGLASTWCHPLNNIWFIESSQSAKSICEVLVEVVDSNDEVFVMEVKTPANAWWNNLSDKVSYWLKSHL